MTDTSRHRTPKVMEPDRFCRNDGVETGIRVAEGYDLCLDCFRAYKAARAQTVAAPRPVHRPAEVGDLFGRDAA